MYRRSCGQGDRSQGGPPVPTPKARGAATASRRPPRLCALVGTLPYSRAPRFPTRPILHNAGQAFLSRLASHEKPSACPALFFSASLPRWRRDAFCVSSVSFLNARLRAVQRARQSVDTTPPYNESYFLLETYLPFLLFSAMILFLKSTKHPYFVKKSLDLIFQRD